MTLPVNPLMRRRLQPVVLRLLDAEPVIAIHGPRSVGKSTLLHQTARELDVDVIDLDDPIVRADVASSPMQAVNEGRPVCIDEYQHVPEILGAIKARLNREGSLPATALLTGSTRQDALPRTAEALTGRLHTLTIWPLSQGEIHGKEENLLPSLLTDATATANSLVKSTTTKSDYIERACAGGFPLAIRRKPADRARWFADYITSSLERDARELSRIRERRLLRDVLDRLASRTGSILDVSKAMAGLQGERKTHDNYIRLLEDLFLVRRLPAWGTTLAARTAKSPKVHMVDSGLGAHLLGLTPRKISFSNPSAMTEFGHILETFVFGELAKQTTWNDDEWTLGHWRTSQGTEVDIILEHGDGLVLGFEVKAGEKVTQADAKGLATLRDLIGKRFTAGVIFTTGTRSYSLDDRIFVMPIDRLWRTVPM